MEELTEEDNSDETSTTEDEQIPEEGGDSEEIEEGEITPEIDVELNTEEVVAELNAEEEPAAHPVSFVYDSDQVTVNVNGENVSEKDDLAYEEGAYSFDAIVADGYEIKTVAAYAGDPDKEGEQLANWSKDDSDNIEKRNNRITISEEALSEYFGEDSETESLFIVIETIEVCRVTFHIDYDDMDAFETLQYKIGDSGDETDFDNGDSVNVTMPEGADKETITLIAKLTTEEAKTNTVYVHQDGESITPEDDGTFKVTLSKATDISISVRKTETETVTVKQSVLDATDAEKEPDESLNAATIKYTKNCVTKGDGKEELAKDSDLTFTVTPADGYDLSKVEYQVGTGDKQTLTATDSGYMVPKSAYEEATEVTVIVTVVKKEYKVSFSLTGATAKYTSTIDGTTGSATDVAADTEVVLYLGDKVTFTVTPDETGEGESKVTNKLRYVGKSADKNEDDALPAVSGSYTFEADKDTPANTTIYVVAEAPKTVNVNFTVGAGAEVSELKTENGKQIKQAASSSIAGTEDGSVSFIALAAEGSKVLKVEKLTGKNEDGEPVYDTITGTSGTYYETADGEAKQALIYTLNLADVTEDITINVVTDTTTYTAALDEMLNGGRKKDITGGNGIETDAVYTVDYDHVYKVSVKQGAQKTDLTKADLAITGGSATTVSEATDGKTKTLDITVGKADAGKELEVTLKAGADTVAAFKLNVLPSLDGVKLKNADGEEVTAVTQTMDTMGKYEMVIPEGRSAEDIASVTSSDNAIATAVVKDGALNVTTEPTANGTGMATLTLEHNSVSVSNGTYTAGTTEIAKITVTLAPPAWANAADGVVPTVTATTSTDVSVNLHLEAAGVDNPSTGAIWYKVEATADASNGDKKLTDDDINITSPNTFYVKKTGDAQDVTLKVIDEKAGEGYDWNFKVKATLVQTSSSNISILNGDTKNNVASNNTQVEGASVCTGKTGEEIDAKTLARALENKVLKVKAGKKSIFTGEKNVLIATANFSSDNVTSRVLKAEDLTWPYNDVRFSYNDNGEVYMSVDANGDGDDWNEGIIGSHTIRISASYPEDNTYIEYAEVKVNVQRGIEKINIQEASDTIYMAKNKAGSLKTTTTLNTGYYTGNTRKPKSAKVSYDLIKADSNEQFRTPTEITVSNKGVVSVKKNFAISPKATENTFRVRVTATDFTGNTTSDITEPISVTNEVQEAFGAVCIIDPTSDIDKDGNDIYNVLAKTDSAKKPAEQKFTSDQLQGKVVAVVKKDAVVGKTVKADDILEMSNDDTSYFTYTSSNKKALEVTGSGYLNVLKAGVKNIKITVSANDGSKRSANIQKLAIDYVAENLGVKVERLEEGYYKNGTYVDAVTLSTDKADQTFSGTTDTVFKITAVKADGKAIDKFVDYKVSVSGAGKLDTSSDMGNTSAVTYIIANKEKATITLQYKANAGDKKYAKKTFTLTNGDWIKNKKQTLKVKTTDKLLANSVGEQHIKYSLTNANDLKKALGIEEFGSQYYVMVNVDKASRKKTPSLYSTFISACYNVEGRTNLENDGTFTLDFKENHKIPAGKYKLQLTLGTIDINGEFVPASKTVAVTLAATALKTSYKPQTKVTLSVTDQTSVRLTGKASKFTPAYEMYRGIYNGVVNNQPNHFTDYFKVVEGYDWNTGSAYSELSLKSTEELLDYAVEKYNTDSSHTTKLNVATMSAADKNAMVAEELAYITSAEAKDDRWGYLDCEVQDTNSNWVYDSVDGNDKKVVMTVSFKSASSTVKAVGKYSAAPVTIAAGDTEAYVTVTGTLNKQNVGIAYAALETNEYGFALDTAKDGYNSYNAVIGNTVHFTLTKEQAAALQISKKGYKVNLKVIPSGSSVAARLNALYPQNNAADTTANKEAREALINTYGVNVPVTIKVADLAKATGKLSVKKDLSFWRDGFWDETYDTYYNAAAGEYVIDVPCGLTMGTDAVVKAAITPNKNNLAKTDDANTKLIGMSIETIGTAPNQYNVIRFTVGKEDLAKVDASKSGKWKKVKYGSKLSTKADITFVQTTTEKDESGKDVEKETALKAETLTFNLTLPDASLKADTKFNISSPGSLVKDVTDAVSAGIGSEYEINWPTRETDNSKYDENSDNYNDVVDAFDSTYGEELANYVKDVIMAVRSEIQKNAPYDTGVDVIMTQLQDENGNWTWNGYDDITSYIKSKITATDFVLPATSTLGRDNGELTVKATLVDTDSWDETAKKYTKTADLEFNIRLSATKEKAVDVQKALDKFVSGYAVGSFTCPDITDDASDGCGCSDNFAQHLVNAAKKAGNTTQEAIEGWITNYMYNDYLNAAREAVALSNPAATTLRLNYMNGVTVYTDSSDKINIYGEIHVWGVRYGDPDDTSGNTFAQKTLSYTATTSATAGTDFNEIVDAIEAAIGEIENDEQIKNALEEELKAALDEAVAECAKVSSEVTASVTNLVRVAPTTGKKGSVKFNVVVESTSGEKSTLSFGWTIGALRRESAVTTAITTANTAELNKAVENAIAAELLKLTVNDYEETGEENAKKYTIKEAKETEIKAAAETALLNAVKGILGSDQANYDARIKESEEDGTKTKHFAVELFSDSEAGALSYEVEVFKKGTTPEKVLTPTIKDGSYTSDGAQAVELTANAYVYTLAQAAYDAEKALKAVDDWTNSVDADAVEAKLPPFASDAKVSAEVTLGTVSAATFEKAGSFSATVTLKKAYDAKTDAAEPAETEKTVDVTGVIPVLKSEESAGSGVDAQTVAKAIADEVTRRLESEQTVTNEDAETTAKAEKEKNLKNAAGAIVTALPVTGATVSVAVKENAGLTITKANMNKDGSATITFTVTVVTGSNDNTKTERADAVCSFTISKPVQDLAGFKAAVNETIDALYGKERKIEKISDTDAVQTEITTAIEALQGNDADATLTDKYSVAWNDAGLAKSIRKAVVTYSGTLEIQDKDEKVVDTIDVKLTVADSEKSSEAKVNLSDCVVTVKNNDTKINPEEGLDLGSAPSETAKVTLTVEVKTGEGTSAAVVDPEDYTITGHELTVAGNQKVTVTAKNTRKYTGSKDVAFEVTVGGKYALSTLTWAVYKITTNDDGEEVKTPITATNDKYTVTTIDESLTNGKAPSDIEIEVSHNAVVMKEADVTSKTGGITWGTFAPKENAENVHTGKVTIAGYSAEDKKDLDFEITVTSEEVTE